MRRRGGQNCRVEFIFFPFRQIRIPERGSIDRLTRRENKSRPLTRGNRMAEERRKWQSIIANTCYRRSARHVFEENSIAGARNMDLAFYLERNCAFGAIYPASFPQENHESRESRSTPAPSETRDYVNPAWITDDRDLIPPSHPPSLSFGHATSTMFDRGCEAQTERLQNAEIRALF